MNIQRRTARVSIRLLRCLILWGYDRSRHENITYGGIFYVRKRVQHSGEHGFDVVAFRIMHESGIIGRAVVRARAGFAVVGAAVAPTITTWLIAQYGLHSAGLYMFALALVSVVAWALTPETKDVDYTK